MSATLTKNKVIIKILSALIITMVGGENMGMTVYNIRIKIYLIKDLPAEKVRGAVTEFLDSGLGADLKFAEFHKKNKYKYYSYDRLYPIEEDKVYKKDRIYTLTIRTLDINLAKYFAEYVVNTYTDKLKGLTAQVRIIPQKHIDVLYTLTPAILKCGSGYWKDEMTVEDYEERMKINLIKKWNEFHGEKIQEDFELFHGLEFLNKCPIADEYKGIKLLGDKIRVHVADNEMAQKLSYMALGSGLLEVNSRGYGFVNYRWL